jgi:hypothetical protein
MRKNIIFALCLTLSIISRARTEAGDCSALPSWKQVKAALSKARSENNGGLNLDMWASLVNRDGIVCSVVFTGNDRGDQWPGSRVISAQKANTANAFSLPKLALSTANLFSAVQPGGSLFGLQLSNPVNTEAAYAGKAEKFGQAGDPSKKIYKKLPGWISAHGKISQGGGSSQLERTVYKEHQKLAKDQEDPKKKKKPEKGVEYDSIFKTTTVDVKKDPNDPNSKDYTVARTEIVEEPLKEIEKVGTNSAEGIIKAGKESEFRNDANAMPNMAFLYESARRGVVAMWNSATANLAQRRANKSIESGRGLGVNEDFSSCDKWGQATLKAYKNPSATDQQLITQQIQDCKLLMSKNYKDINPEIDTKKDGNNKIQTTVKNGDFKTEDEKERDLRAQINVIDKAGIRLNEVQTNWNYTDKDEKAKVVTSYNEDGKANQAQDLRVDEQIDLYNKGLQEAAESYEKIKKNLPTLNTDPKDILANQIQMKSKRIDQIMEITPSEAEEFGLKKGPSQEQLPQYYEDLQNTK